MSRYTLRLSDVCEILYNEKDYYLNVPYEDMVLPDLPNPFNAPDIDTILEKVRPKIFDFDYPLPNGSEEKKKELEIKILKHYYTREIGFDSWGRFKLALNEKLNLIMPYFNDLYKSIELQGDNPLTNNEIKEVKKTTNASNSSGTSNVTNNSSNKSVFEDTPTSKIGNTDYATNITTNNVDTTSNGTSTGEVSGNENMERTITGLSNFSKQDMIARYRENIINVDEAIVNELYDIFLLIYN